ncbi:hypothetical protein D9C73_011949 [Collichthys lucidus]|uniref:Uncharacterized protein n=1 Tax=Collichthys lucidus TaxID=240159 RepID=A0A4U5UT20_COLLU|nr:hypothetical protein D9C73_011949 [Collichthys lucidus]
MEARMKDITRQMRQLQSAMDNAKDNSEHHPSTAKPIQQGKLTPTTQAASAPQPSIQVTGPAPEFSQLPAVQLAHHTPLAQRIYSPSLPVQHAAESNPAESSRITQRENKAGKSQWAKPASVYFSSDSTIVKHQQTSPQRQRTHIQPGSKKDQPTGLGFEG